VSEQSQSTEPQYRAGAQSQIQSEHRVQVQRYRRDKNCHQRKVRTQNTLMKRQSVAEEVMVVSERRNDGCTDIQTIYQNKVYCT
jgi:hypothetical protein